MTDFKHIFTIFRWLSFDVVLGSVIFTCAVASIAEVTLPWSIPTALGCCVWLIYTLDHLIDGNQSGETPTLERHLFHRKHRKSIFITFLIVAFFGLVLLFALPYYTLVYGCVLLGLVGLYFLSIWIFKIYFAKEIFIAVLYACGIFLGVFSLKEDLGISLYYLFAQSILMASINLLLFSYYEVEFDKQDGHRSWATHFGLVNTVKHLRWLFVLQFILIITAFYFHGSSEYILVQIIFMVMTIVLGLIYLNPLWFKRNERFRSVGDLVFLFPGIIYLF